MKTRRRYVQLRDTFVLLWLVVCTSAYGEVDSSHALAIGNPGLKIVYKTTNQFVIFTDEPRTVGPGLMGGYYDRHIDVVLDRNYGLKEKLTTRRWGDIPEQLYPFGDEAAFTCEGGAWSSDGKTWNCWPRSTQVFTLRGNGMVVSHDVYGMARDQYGLGSNQLFLGKLGTNIFYWETRDPQKVFCRSVGGGNASCFVLPKGILDILGATQGIKENENIGVSVFRKSKGFFHYAPSEFAFVEISFKDAKTIQNTAETGN